MTMSRESEDPISRDVLCRRCGYNLRTLTRQSRCPDCGLPVETSLNMERAQPSLARGAGRLATGMWVMAGVILFGICVQFYSYLLYKLVPGYFYMPANYLVVQPCWVAMTVGEFVVTLLVVSSGLAPNYLKWGGVHAPLFCVCTAIEWLGGILCMALSELFVWNHLSHAGVRLGVYQAYYGILLLVNVAGTGSNIYSFCFLRSLCDRPEFFGLRGYTLPLYGAIWFFNALSIAYRFYVFALLVQIPIGRPLPAVESAYEIISLVRLSTNIGAIVYTVAFALAARRILRHADLSGVPTVSVRV